MWPVLGGQNVLSGTVAAVANGIARLVSNSGEQYTVPVASQVSVNDPMSFAIRRDHIALEKDTQHGADAPAEINAIYGVIHAIEYQGAYVKITLQRPGHEDFVAHLADSDFFTKQLAIGDRVMARWSVEAIHPLGAERSHARREGRSGSATREAGDASAP